MKSFTIVTEDHKIEVSRVENGDGIAIFIGDQITGLYLDAGAAIVLATGIAELLPMEADDGE